MSSPNPIRPWFTDSRREGDSAQLAALEQDLHNTLESLANIFYLLKMQPSNPDVIQRCGELGDECVRRLTRDLAL